MGCVGLVAGCGGLALVGFLVQSRGVCRQHEARRAEDDAMLLSLREPLSDGGQRRGTAAAKVRQKYGRGRDEQ